MISSVLLSVSWGVSHAQIKAPSNDSLTMSTSLKTPDYTLAQASPAKDKTSKLLSCAKGDKDCERRSDALILNSLGEREAAMKLMCSKPSVALAMKDSGRDCNSQRNTDGNPVLKLDPVPNSITASSVRLPVLQR